MDFAPYFIPPDEDCWKAFHDQWLDDSYKFLLSIGLRLELRLCSAVPAPAAPMASDTPALLLLLLARALAAAYSNIADCDETFNYWEPVSPNLSSSSSPFLFASSSAALPFAHRSAARLAIIRRHSRCGKEKERAVIVFLCPSSVAFLSSPTFLSAAVASASAAVASASAAVASFL